MSVRTAAPVIELHVDNIAAGGDGVGRHEGLVVFVPRTAPGDVASVRLEKTRRFARGELEELIVPSPDRVTPPCEHYTVDRCGGCQLQHLAYGAQLSVKRQIVADAVRRIAKRSVDPPPIRPSPREWRYRTKLTLTMRRRSNGWTMGLRPYDDPASIFQLRDCPITDERVVATWREIMAAAEWLPDVAELRGVVRLIGDDMAVIIRGAAKWPHSSEFFDAVPSAGSLWWFPEGERGRLVCQRREAPTAASFGQVNAAVADAMHAYIVQLISAHAPSTVIDAYSGTGRTSVVLARTGMQVTAIELDREAAAYCARQLPPDSRTLVGRVEDLLTRALPVDALILNPPRIGLHERVTAALDRATPLTSVIVYVSCDPATLARDLGRLTRYAIASIVSFDMFPQTAHVETVCELVPAA